MFFNIACENLIVCATLKIWDGLGIRGQTQTAAGVELEQQQHRSQADESNRVTVIVTDGHVGTNSKMHATRSVHYN